MTFDYLTFFIPTAILTALALSILATRRVQKDVGFSEEQRSMQLWLIWLAPILGASLVLSVLRDEPVPDRSTTHDTRS